MMVCEVCSVDRSYGDGVLVILDYPRFLECDSPCLNCGVVTRPNETAITLREWIERRRARSVATQACGLNA